MGNWPEVFMPDCPNSMRACNALAEEFQERPITPEIIARLKRSELLRIPNFGKFSLNETELWLDRHNLKLQDTVEKLKLKPKKTKSRQLAALENRVKRLEEVIAPGEMKRRLRHLEKLVRDLIINYA
jgi:hypothetical protein